VEANPSADTKLKMVRSKSGEVTVWARMSGRDRKLVSFRLHRTKKGGETGTEPHAAANPSRRVRQVAFEPDARARAMLRGVEISEADLDTSGGAFDLAQVQKLLHGVSRQSIDKRVREKSLLAVPVAGRRRRYPTVQFNRDGTVVRGLPEVLKALNFESPWATLNYLVNPDDRLGNRRPIDVLRRGDIRLVLESARRVDEQGA